MITSDSLLIYNETAVSPADGADGHCSKTNPNNISI